MQLMDRYNSLTDGIDVEESFPYKKPEPEPVPVVSSIDEIKTWEQIPADRAHFSVAAPQGWGYWSYHLTDFTVLSKREKLPPSAAEIESLEVMKPGQFFKTAAGLFFFRTKVFGQVVQLVAEIPWRMVDTEFRKPFPSDVAETTLQQGIQGAYENIAKMIAANPSEKSLLPALAAALNDEIVRPVPPLSEGPDLDIWPRIKNFFKAFWAVITNKESN